MYHPSSERNSILTASIDLCAGQAAVQLDVTVEEVMNPHPVLLDEHLNIK